MNKIKRKHLEYSEGVRYNKFLVFKKAQEKYLANRSKENFERLRNSSEVFQRYVKLHLNKCNRFYK